MMASNINWSKVVDDGNVEECNGHIKEGECIPVTDTPMWRRVRMPPP
jgi:hypothetical protein